MSERLEDQVAQNTATIQQMLDDAKKIGDVPKISGDPNDADMFILEIASTGQTVSITKAELVSIIEAGVGEKVAYISLINNFIKTNNFKRINSEDVKSDYEYNSDIEVITQTGGDDIGDFLGIESNILKGFFNYYVNNAKYNKLMVVNTLGDFLGAGAQKDIGTMTGTIRKLGDGYSAFFTHPMFTTTTVEEDDFEAKVKSINTGLDHAHVHTKTKGMENEATPIPGYGEEALVEMHASNVETDKTRVYVSPHFFDIGNLIKLAEGYKNSTFKEGYTHTDTSEKTGTPQTVLGPPKTLLGIDENGNAVVAEPTKIADTGAALTLNNALGTLCNMASANSSGGYSISGTPVAGAWNRILINTTNQPNVIPASIIKGSSFKSNTDMYLVVWNNGNRNEYWFEEI